MTSDRPTIPAPRVRADVQRLRRLAAALRQLADALNGQTPGEITARTIGALAGEIEHFVGRLAVALGLRWATGQAESGEGDAEGGAVAHVPSVYMPVTARESAP